MKTEDEERDENTYETNWDRSDHGECLPCDIGIDELGNFQCINCLEILNYLEEKRRIIECLKDLHGEAWRPEWKKLIICRKLVKDRAFYLLTEERYVLRDQDGIIKTVKYFYHA